MKCKACNTDNLDTAKYCANCGNFLSSTCPHCGADITNTDYFCPICGGIIQYSTDSEVIDITSEPIKSTSEKEPLISEDTKTTIKKTAKAVKIVLLIIGFGLPFIGTMIMSTFITGVSCAYDIFFGI